jgi:hypothetical protein
MSTACPILRLSFQIALLIYINHQISTLNVQTHIFVIKYISIKPIQHQKNVQYTKVNNKYSALLCIPVPSAKAYVNQFLTLRNPMYSRRAYLYWMSNRVEGNIGNCTGRGNVEEVRRRNLIKSCNYSHILQFHIKEF